MKNRLIGFGIFGLTFVLAFTWFQSINQNVPKVAAHKAAPVEEVQQGPRVLNSENAAASLPPDTFATSDFPAVNTQRLQKLAGAPYKGPSYKVKAGEMKEMIAERKKDHDKRLPASK